MERNTPEGEDLFSASVRAIATYADVNSNIHLDRGAQWRLGIAINT